MLKVIILTGVCLSLVLTANAQESIEDQLKSAVEENLGNINITAATDDAKKAFKKKCMKEGSEEDYERAETGLLTLKDCLEGLIDIDTVTQEIEKAKPNGDLDTVFKKYCGKSPELKQCVSNFTKTIKGCLSQKEQENIDIVLNITESLTDFICFKEGDRIALFIAEGGPECLEEKINDIGECANATFSKRVPQDVGSISVDDIPEFVFDDKLCSEIQTVQDCIVEKLVSCKEPTPSNIAESLFKFIRQVTPCEKQTATPKSGKHTSNSASSQSALTFLVAGVATYLLKTAY